MTERAERQPPAIEELLASLDTCPLAVVSLDPEGRVTYWSGGAETLFGWQSEEVLGRELPTVPEDRRAEFERVHERQRRGESLAAYQTQRLRKDGSLVDVAVWSAGRFGDDGAFLGTVAYVALLEAGELADVLLGTRREEFQALVDASPLAIIAIDTEGMVTTWNAEAEALFGWSAAEALGAPLRHIPDSLRQSRREHPKPPGRRRGAARRGDASAAEDGAEIEVAIWSASRHDARGRFLGTLAFVADISERKQAERRDRAAHERAETLRRLSAQLASAATPQEVVEVLADEGARALEAERPGWHSRTSPPESYGRSRHTAELRRASRPPRFPSRRARPPPTRSGHASPSGSTRARTTRLATGRRPRPAGARGVRRPTPGGGRPPGRSRVVPLSRTRPSPRGSSAAHDLARRRVRAGIRAGAAVRGSSHDRAPPARCERLAQGRCRGDGGRAEREGPLGPLCACKRCGVARTGSRKRRSGPRQDGPRSSSGVRARGPCERQTGARDG